MKIYTANRETGDIIEEVKSYEEGMSLIADYEAEDKADGSYSPDFYDIVDEDRFSIISKDVYSVEWSRAGECDRQFFPDIDAARKAADKEVNCRSQFDLDRCRIAVNSHRITIRECDDSNNYRALDSAILDEDIPCLEGCNALCDAIDFDIIHEGKYYVGA